MRTGSVAGDNVPAKVSFDGTGVVAVFFAMMLAIPTKTARDQLSHKRLNRLGLDLRNPM